jgi:hypothetical protein
MKPSSIIKDLPQLMPAAAAPARDGRRHNAQIANFERGRANAFDHDGLAARRQANHENRPVFHGFRELNITDIIGRCYEDGARSSFVARSSCAE